MTMTWHNWSCLIIWIYSVFLIHDVECATNQSRIVSKVKATGDCLDASGNVMNDGDNWPSAPGVCDNNICFIVFSGKFIVQERCRPLAPTENPDTTNCQLVEDNSKPFPECCPKLQCSERSPLTTLSPSVCLDLAATFACEFWRNETFGCQTGINDVFYNYTRDYCRKTCGHC
ncbi:uncharacterized protein LOC126818798 [Patella vulgata]|uniref:uncharacterized protein LOC126818798 n=1 Tax=Patella vulgata TaxID=6465 RepID=UPI00217FD8CA|nr:uncharacterized protein LOC126818798 [Patella vulgata]